MGTFSLAEAVERSVLCWLATADAAGAPSVSPKEVFAAAGEDRVLIADIASPRSVRNIAAQQRVCLALLDVFAQRGHQLYGSARILAPGDERWVEASDELERITQGRYPFRRIIEVTVDRVHPIVAPSYALYPEVPEAERRAAAMRSYGVRPER